MHTCNFVESVIYHCVIILQLRQKNGVSKKKKTEKKGERRKKKKNLNLIIIYTIGKQKEKIIKLAYFNIFCKFKKLCIISYLLNVLTCINILKILQSNIVFLYAKHYTKMNGIYKLC